MFIQKLVFSQKPPYFHLLRVSALGLKVESRRGNVNQLSMKYMNNTVELYLIWWLGSKVNAESKDCVPSRLP